MRAAVSSSRNKGEMGRFRREAAANRHADIVRCSAIQQLYGFFVDTSVAAGHNGFSLAAMAAVPGGHDAAGAFDQWDQRRNVPAVEVGLDDDVDENIRPYINVTDIITKFDTEDHSFNMCPTQ